MPIESQLFLPWGETRFIWEKVRAGSRGFSPNIDDGPPVETEICPTSFSLLSSQYAEQAHALGNPLASLGLATELLGSASYEEGVSRHVHRIERSQQGLQRLHQRWSALAGARLPEMPLPVRVVAEDAGFAPAQSFFDASGSTEMSSVTLLRFVLSGLRDNIPSDCAYALCGRHLGERIRLSVIDKGREFPATNRAALWRDVLPGPDGRGDTTLVQVGFVVEKHLRGWVAYTPVLGGGSAFHLDFPITLGDPGRAPGLLS